ncbi:hypothetical protein [Gulosibacter hominis]|uniref:hypothetical protein n=1 Tax=Gulosibacter hominis TaxID=2770504 RepID=UPI00191B0B70|nr:hypothetical protein [Gulosibacter hominis]
MIQIACDLTEVGVDKSLRKISYLSRPFKINDGAFRDLYRGVQILWSDSANEVWIDIDGERATDADTLSIASDIYRQLTSDGLEFSMTDVNTGKPYKF